MPTVHGGDIGRPGDVLKADVARDSSGPLVRRRPCTSPRATVLRRHHNSSLPEQPLPPPALEEVVDAVHLPPVVHEKSASVVPLYVHQVHDHGHILLL
jgi:hypothetical protein